MNRTGPTRKRSRRSAVSRVSLFPFLAVLICTMGALILLLVVISRQARLQAAQVSESQAAKRQEEAARRAKKLKESRGEAQWMAEQFEISRQKTADQLSEARLELGHIEDHARQLADQLARLKAVWEDLRRGDSQRRPQSPQLEAELDQTEAMTAEADRRLAEAQREADRRRQSYAVVPYEGLQKTLRRPIYIECRDDAIVFQPEGIALTPGDFQGEMGPGNPLAVGLRAAREHLLARGDLDGKPATEPYPLLLVRPDGIVAYYAARAALKSWEAEFGYELIGADWRLEFPAADPELGRVVARAVQEAQWRRRQLTALLGGGHGRGTGQGTEYTVSRGSGGIVRTDGLPIDAAPQSGESKPANTFGQSLVSGGREGSRSVPSIPERTTPGPGQNPSGTGPQHSGDQRGGEPPKLGQYVESLSKQRGKNWALPDTPLGATALTRPIRVECYRDRLVLVPERGLRGGVSVPLRQHTQESIDEFASAVRAYVRSWGMAGERMYWQPVLSIRVAPDAERCFADLQTLLDGSGFLVERKGVDSRQ